MATADQIIAEIRVRDHSDAIDDTLDFIYATLDDLMIAGDFATVDAVLADGFAGLSTVTLLGLLTITFAASTKLAQRALFARDVRAILTDRDPERVNDLMRGLD